MYQQTRGTVLAFYIPNLGHCFRILRYKTIATTHFGIVQ